MKTEIVTNLQNASFEARRSFAADVQAVWRAFTEAALLDQWWAPKPWRAETVSMDFRPGGRWVYVMVGPNGERHGSIQLYDLIEKEVFFSGTDAFSDEAGHILENMPVAAWRTDFTATPHGTFVVTTATYPTREALETVLKMGMAEGVTMAHDNLDEVIANLASHSTWVSVQATINAPKDEVWEYYLHPDHITQWNFASPDWHCPWAKNDLRVGGMYTARMEAKDGSWGFDFAATYTEVEPGHRLAYTIADGRKAIISFKNTGVATLVTVSFEAEKQNPVQMQQQGWQAILDSFKAYAESR